MRATGMSIRKKRKLPKRNAPSRQSQQPPSNVFREPSPSKTGNGSVVQLTEAFSGPVPHPSILAGYDKVVPGAAERILKMAEQNLSHQQYMEKNALSAQRMEVTIGQIFAFIVVLVAFVTSAWFAYRGHAWEGTILGGAILATIVVAFIKGRDSK